MTMITMMIIDNKNTNKNNENNNNNSASIVSKDARVTRRNVEFVNFEITF